MKLNCHRLSRADYNTLLRDKVDGICHGASIIPFLMCPTETLVEDWRLRIWAGIPKRVLGWGFC